MYLLTRPIPVIRVSQTAFEREGLAVCVLGLIDIQTSDTGVAAFAQHLQHHTPDIVIITSKYAVRACAVHLKSLDKPTVIMAVGTGTAAALAGLELDAVIPQTPTSEGLLALPQLIDAKRKQIVIIKGEAGRTTLTEQLTERGAAVNTIAVYRRTYPAHIEQTNQWQWPDVQGIIATSEEMSERLFTQLDNTQLRSRPWLTVSQRVANYIRQQGVSAVNVVNGASDAQLSQWIKENWE